MERIPVAAVIRRALLALWLLLSPVQAHAVIALVDKNHGRDVTGSAVTSISAGAVNAPSGALLVVGCRQGTDNTTIPTVSDTAGNSFTSIDSASVDSGNLYTMFYSKNITGNATDITKCNWSVGQAFVSDMTLVYTGADTSTPLDTHTSGTASGVSSVTSPNFTTTVANEVLVEMATPNSISINFNIPTAGWTQEDTDNGTSSMTQAGDKIVSAIQTNVNVNVHDQGASSLSWEIVVATFKQASGAAACQPTLTLMGVGC